MSFSKNVMIVSLLLGVTIFGIKRSRNKSTPEIAQVEMPSQPISAYVVEESAGPDNVLFVTDSQQLDFPEVDRIHEIFCTNGPKFSFVETIKYTSHVPWLKGKPAWIADYASYFATSRHFIARSLNRKADYSSQKISTGQLFNVLSRDKNINFHLLVDLSLKKMGFYAVDLDTDERTLIKVYPVAVGQLDSSSPSGCLTPVGKYTLGSKIGVYQAGKKGFFQGEKIEMVREFGTRWIPFEYQMDKDSMAADGVGIHGAPFVEAPDGSLVEDRMCIQSYSSKGCIRMLQDDVEELFSIVITKPTCVEVVRNLGEADTSWRTWNE